MSTRPQHYAQRYAQRRDVPTLLAVAGMLGLTSITLVFTVMDESVTLATRIVFIVAGLFYLCQVFLLMSMRSTFKLVATIPAMSLLQVVVQHVEFAMNVRIAEDDYNLPPIVFLGLILLVGLGLIVISALLAVHLFWPNPRRRSWAS